MKMSVLSLVSLMLVSCHQALAQTGSPVQKVMELLTGLQEKVTAEGSESKTLFEEVSAFCKDRTRELQFEIKTGKETSQELEAVIAKAVADIQAFAAKVDELTASIGDSEAELKEATALRQKEAADFSAAEKELTETISTIERATAIIEREMAKGTSMAQLSGTEELTSALSALVQATTVETADREKLAALIQSQSEDGDDAVGAPDAAVYESHSAGITDALDGLLDKAQTSLDEARKTESESLHAYEMKKQSLEDSLKFANKDLDAAKKSSSAASEKKAVAEGDLAATTKDLKADEENLEGLQHDCMEKAQAYEEETASREAELKAIAEAKKAVADATGGAEKLAYGFTQAPALLQVSEEHGSVKAVRVVRRLAFAQHSASLARLASRLETVLHRSADPFAKVKGLISNMIEKLEEEAGAEATQKAFCDKEMAETTSKKEDTTSELDKLTTKLDQMAATSAKLKEEVVTLSKELTELARTQAEMDKLRTNQKATFEANKPQMEQGIEGVKLALKILRDYYAADSGSPEGAASGIIGLLEVCESDFSKGLATMIADEEAAAAEYEQESKENEITKTAKQQDVDYKKKELASLEKASAETKSDITGVQEQLDAVMQYMKELEKQCVAKAESYEERVERRNAEIVGLKSALEVLGSGEDTALLQRGAAKRHVRQGASLRGHSFLRVA